MIGSRRHGYGVFSGLVDQDQRHTGCIVRIAHDQIRVYAVPAITGDGLIAESVRTDSGYELDLGSKAGGCNGLIGALSTGCDKEFTSDDGLSRRIGMRRDFTTMSVLELPTTTILAFFMVFSETALQYASLGGVETGCIKPPPR